MKKYLALLLAVLMVLTALAGCASQQAETTTPDAPAATTDNTPETDTTDTQPDETTTSGEKTKISFMGWGTDAEIATYTAMIDQFEAAYPDVEVEYIVVADNEFDTKLQTMIGSGQAPDVFYCSIDKMMKYAATGNLLSLTDYVNNNEIFDPNNVWECLNDLYRYDGENQGSAGGPQHIKKGFSAHWGDAAGRQADRPSARMGAVCEIVCAAVSHAPAQRAA